VAKADLPSVRGATHVARSRKRARLPGDDAAGLLSLPIYFHDVDAVHLPERHRTRRQRRAAAQDELERIEAELVQDRPKHRGAADLIEQVMSRRGAPGPATPGVL